MFGNGVCKYVTGTLNLHSIISPTAADLDIPAWQLIKQIQDLFEFIW